MCLNRIDKVIDQPTDEVVDAWKVVLKWNFPDGKSYLRGVCYGPSTLQTNKWIEAEKVRVYSYEDLEFVSYVSGFHVFVKHKDALLYQHQALSPYAATIPVQVRKVRTEGMQSIMPTINSEKLLKTLVADEMFIPASQ